MSWDKLPGRFPELEVRAERRTLEGQSGGFRITKFRGAWQERLTARVASILSALALVAAVASLAAAAPSRGGDPDPSFGSAGLVTTDLTSDADRACCVAMQADGKIVVAGSEASVNGSAGHAFVARYLPNGTLDSSFGGSGVVRPRFSTGDDLVQALAIQPDGKIVAAGSVVAPDTNIALARSNADGGLDAGFGSGGKVITAFAPSSRERALAASIAGDGKIVVAGAARGGGLPSGNFLVARYNPDGTLDQAFGSGGKVITDFGSLAEAHGVAIDAGGKIVAVGGMFSVSPAGGFWGKAFVAARYNQDGTIDTSFGGGKVLTDFGTDSYANDVTVQRDGKVLTVGWVGAGNSPGTIVRHNPDGSLDASFGEGGRVVLELPEAGSFIGAVALDSHERIVTAGNVGGANIDFELARFKPNGDLDAAFGRGGAVSTNFAGNSYDTASDIALQQDGKPILAGESDGKIALARYLPTYCFVPNVKGKPLAAAKAAILKAQCAVGRVTRISSRTVRTGRVVRQLPRAGTQQREGRAVALVVSRGR